MAPPEDRHLEPARQDGPATHAEPCPHEVREIRETYLSSGPSRDLSGVVAGILAVIVLVLLGLLVLQGVDHEDTPDATAATIAARA